MGARGPACPMRKGYPFERIDAKRGRRAGIAACRSADQLAFRILAQSHFACARDPCVAIRIHGVVAKDRPAHGGAYAGANYDCTHGRRNDRIRRAILSSIGQPQAGSLGIRDRRNCHPARYRDGLVAAGLQSSQSDHGNYRPIPPLAWIPLSILWFGIGDEQNEFIIFLGMFFRSWSTRSLV